MSAAPGSLRRLWPLAIMLLLGIIWGGTPSISKFIATHGVPPLGSVFWQSGLAAAVLLTIAYLRGGRVPLTWRAAGYFLAVGFVGYALPNANMILVTGHIPAGLMAVVLTLNPVFTYLWILALRIERPNARRAGGIALGLAGALVLVLPRGTLPDPAALPWLLGAFVTPVLYSFGNAWAEKHRPSGMDSFALAGAMVGAASVGMGVAALATGTFHPIWQEASAVNLVILFYAALSVAIFYLFFELIRLAGALAVAQVAYIMTLMGLGWGAVLYGERPSPWVWLAIALVFAGVALVNFGKGARKTAAEA